MIYPQAIAPLAVANPLFGLGVGIGVAQAPIADFTATPTTVPVGTFNQFTDASTGNVVTRLWEYNDNVGGGWVGFSSAVNPQPEWDTPGTFSIRLTVTNPIGSNTKTRLNYIVVA